MKQKRALTISNFYESNFKWLLLLVLYIIFYSPVLRLDLVNFDDSTFINDRHDFLSNLSNIPRTFSEGVFNVKDVFYRPLFMIYFMCLYPFTSPDSIVIYHIGNFVLHFLNVWLLYKLLVKLLNRKDYAFWLAAFFCFHPVLTMAVAWIPGVNDLLFGAFGFSYLYFFMKLVTEDNKAVQNSALTILFFFCSMFTKETAVILPGISVLLVLYTAKDKLFGRKMFMMYGLIFLVLVIWFFARKRVLPTGAPFAVNADMVSQFMYRLRGLAQYFGKCILPFNLSTYPTIEDTGYSLFFLSVLLLGFLIYLNKERNLPKVAIGAAIFVLALIPILLVPTNKSTLLYEHRLYIPLIGVLLILRETVFFSRNTKFLAKFLAVAAFSLTWLILLEQYIPVFDHPFDFWNNAVTANPKSPSANRIMGAIYGELNQDDDALALFEKSYRLDSTEKYIYQLLARYRYIKKGQNMDSALLLLNKEIKRDPDYPDSYLDLAHVYFTKKDFVQAEKNFIEYLKRRPKDEAVNNNLLLFYAEQKNYTKALIQADNMKQMDMPVNDSLYRLIKLNR